MNIRKRSMLRHQREPIQCIEMSVRSDDFPAIIGLLGFHSHERISQHQIVTRVAGHLAIQIQFRLVRYKSDTIKSCWIHTNVAVTVSLGRTNGYGWTRQSPNLRSKAGLSKTTPGTREICSSSKNGGVGPASTASFYQL